MKETASLLEKKVLDRLLALLTDGERTAGLALIEAYGGPQPNLVKALEDLALVSTYKRIRGSGKHNSHWYAVVRAANQVGVPVGTVSKRLKKMGVDSKEGVA